MGVCNEGDRSSAPQRAKERVGGGGHEERKRRGLKLGLSGAGFSVCWAARSSIRQNWIGTQAH